MAVTVPQIDVRGSRTQEQLDQSTPYDGANPMRATSAGGAACSVTLAADADRENVITQIHCSYSATPTGGAIKIEDVSGTTVFQQYLAATGPYVFEFRPARRNKVKNTALIITLAGGGGAVVGELDVNAHKRA